MQNVSRGQNFGFGVRVLYKGTWGFASSRSVTPDDVRRITQQAVEIAKANSVYQRKRISLVPVEKVVTSWKSAFARDPLAAPPWNSSDSPNSRPSFLEPCEFSEGAATEAALPCSPR